jgi:hypothetical protein
VPISHTVDAAAGLVSLRLEGAVTYEEFAAALAAVVADPAYRTGFSFLSDRRGAATPSSDYARRVIELLRRHADEIGACRWATVVGSPAAYGMARMMEAISEELPVKIRAFTEVADAVAWLGVEPVDRD